MRKQAPISVTLRDVHCTREERRTWGILSQPPPPMSETSQIGGAYRRGAQEYSASPRPPCQRRHKMEGGTLRGRWLSNSSLHIDRSYFDIMSQCCAGLVRVGLEGSVEKPEWWGLSWQTHSTMGNEAHVGIQHWSLEHRGQWHTWSSAFKTL